MRPVSTPCKECLAMTTQKLDKATTPEQVDRWQRQASKPLYAEVAELDKQQAAIVARKREIRDALYGIEQQAVARRTQLQAPNAGPDQQLSLAERRPHDGD